jgi:hypothetical protein
MAWAGFQGASTPFGHGGWEAARRLPHWPVSGCHYPERCPASASWPHGGAMGVHAGVWQHARMQGELGGSHCGDATAKRCTASRITHHVLTVNKVVADAVFVGQEWSGLWSEAAARGMQRESAARSAKRLPCQDSPLDKTPHSVVFVLQRDILRCVYLTIIRCWWGGGTVGLAAARHCLRLSLTLTIMRCSPTIWKPRKHTKGTHRFRARVLWQGRCDGVALGLDAQAALRVDGCPGM